MTYQTIIGKIAEIQHLCTVSLSQWLEQYLPAAFGDQWWSKGVISHLSNEQRQRIVSSNISDLSKIDMAALLRILSGNKYDLINRGYIAFKDRTTLERMFGVRNRWAHLSSNRIKLETILNDLETTIKLLAIITGSKDALYKNVANFIQILQGEGIIDDPAIDAFSADEQESAISDTNTEIKKGDLICLKSNPNEKGMVSEISYVGERKKYLVFINGDFKPFFDEQIQLAAVAASRTVSFTELCNALTAFQISKPTFDSLYSLNAAKVDFVPYQFRPALKIIKSDVPRLLIADSVGVGKTIEAGLILKELQARTPLQNVLIICPKPLVAERKWEMEMRDKFDEEFVPVDGKTLRNILKDYDRTGEWPSRYSRAIIPYSVIKNEEVMNGYAARPGIPGLEKLDPPPHFDLVIVDEAHNIRNSYTNAHKAVRQFCKNADAVIFMTATPLQLGNNDLFTLLNVLYPDKIIDKAAFDAMTEPNSHIHKAIRSLRLGEGHEGEAIESLQSAAETNWGNNVIAPNPLYSKIINTLKKGELSRSERVRIIDETESLNSLSSMINRTRRIDIADSFCLREVKTLRSLFTEHQQKMHGTLLDFESRVLTILHGSNNVKFMMSTLRHQAASCIFGLAPSIEALAAKGVEAITDNCDSENDIVLTDEEANIIVEMAIDLIELSKNLPDEDPKLELLLEIISGKQTQENNKIILFTSFKHTQRYLERKIKAKTSLRIAAVNGDVGDDDRYELRNRFAQPKCENNAIDIMLFTEVGSEGLDYQFCDTMVNYDLPWNPMRIEQRIGRIDRRGQQSEKVVICNCITNGSIDADIYDRCLMRIGIFEQNIGDCAEILGNLADGIDKIVFDNSLSTEQRAEKLEKLAENEIRNMVEMQKLENESKELFGIDISDFTDSLDRADNQWLSAGAVRLLVESYFEKRLNDGKKHLDGKLLRLSAEAKTVIKEDLNDIGIKEKVWNGFLRSSAQSCRIAFEQDEARNDPKAIFVNPTHPLARQAAKFFTSRGEMQIALSVSSADVPGGSYPFSLYSWEFTGDRPRIRLEPICENECIQNDFHNLLQSAMQVHFDAHNYSDKWNEIESKHLKQWEEAKGKYREDAKNLCNYKIESLTQSYYQRKKTAETRAIEKIREGELANLTADYEAATAKLKDIAEKADIHVLPLVKGVIFVKEENI